MAAASSALSTEPANESQLSKVIISVFTWPVAELAGLQSQNKLDPRPAKAASESIDPVTVRGRLSHHLGRNYCSLSGSLVAFWESWQTLGALWRWRRVVERVGRGPILRINDSGLGIGVCLSSFIFNSFIFYFLLSFIFITLLFTELSLYLLSFVHSYVFFFKSPLSLWFQPFFLPLNIIKTFHIPSFFCTLSPKFYFSVMFFNW